MGNPNVSLRSTLNKNRKVEYYIRIKIYKLITLIFLVKNSVNPNLIHILLILYFTNDLLTKDPT